ncbi:uncharacterized protein LOC131942733 [Physella acuta]|uniref:uncharacterized protein LOC131942733 n=1 Tax=Physella acuta TaxID=109671 RepID=UPI0027DE2DF8|nr:uncharacterized protein LOC131942733 [Physella acuta]
MLSGKTSVYIDTFRSDEDATPETQPADEHKKEIPGTRDEESRSDVIAREHFGKFIMHFVAGQGFGEIALLRDNCVRNATIIADTACDLLVVQKKLFDTCIKASQLAEYQEKKRFVESSNIFRGWSPKFRNLLEMSLIKEHHPYGSVIVQQGAPVRGLIFVISGQVKLTVTPRLHKQQFQDLLQKHQYRRHRNRAQSDTDPTRQLTPSQASPRSSKLTAEQIFVRRRFGYAAAEERIKSKCVDISCIEKGQVIGDIETVLDLATSIETAVSTSSTFVYVLNTKNYERLVVKKNPATLGKIQARIAASKATQIPLFDCLVSELKAKLDRHRGTGRFYSSELRKKIQNQPKHLLEIFRRKNIPLTEPYAKASMHHKISSKRHFISRGNFGPRRDIRNKEDKFDNNKKVVPRSIAQLKNNIVAEKELLGVERELVDVSATRPMTSVGFSRKTVGIFSPISVSRPRTAIGVSLKIIECLPKDKTSGWFESAGDGVDTLDKESVESIFEEMEQMREENIRHRIRIVKSAARKAKPETEVSKSGNDEDVFDWETSEPNLRDLEGRVVSFCRAVNDGRSVSGRKTTATSLRRFEVSDLASLPLPGGTVFVHRKMCAHPHAHVNNPSIHRHVRYFILSPEGS